MLHILNLDGFRCVYQFVYVLHFSDVTSVRGCVLCEKILIKEICIFGDCDPTEPM